MQKILIEKNLAAIKLALRLEGDASAQGGAGGGFPFSASAGASSGAPDASALLAKVAKMLGPAGALPGLSPGGTPGSPFGGASKKGAGLPPKLAQAMTAFQKANAPAGAARGKPGAASSAVSTPAMMVLEMVGQVQSLQPIDPGLVARELWKPDFVATISQKLADDKADQTALVSALASLPTKSAREKLKELLHKDRNKGPQDFGKVEAVNATDGAAAMPAATRRRMGRHKKEDQGGFGANADQGQKLRGMRFGIGLQNGGKPEAKKQVVEFGKDWYDPGSLVVLKMVVPYQERPPERVMHRPMYQPARMTPGMERRLHEKAEKQRVLESTYEWRDAIEKSIRQWDDRLSAVAEAGSESQGAGETSSGGDEKEKSSGADEKEKAVSGATKTGKASSQASFKTSKSSSSKTPAAAPVPNPSVAMPFALHAGGTIAKEYHVRWPQDLAASFASATTEPLAVDYVRLQGTGEFGKALSHYRSAITAIPGAKPRIFRRLIENGKWLDAIQKDQTGHRTRSIDVLVTRESSDDDNGKKSGAEELTVEILLVEIETPESDATPGSSKKEPRETTSTTPP